MASSLPRYTPTANVRRGARWLDKVCPGWFRRNKVTLNTLDESWSERCLLRQVFGPGYPSAIRDLGMNFSRSERYGFMLPQDRFNALVVTFSERRLANEKLTNLWKEQIRLRRGL